MPGLFFSIGDCCDCDPAPVDCAVCVKASTTCCCGNLTDCDARHIGAQCPTPLSGASVTFRPITRAKGSVRVEVYEADGTTPVAGLVVRLTYSTLVFGSSTTNASGVAVVTGANLAMTYAGSFSILVYRSPTVYNASALTTDHSGKLVVTWDSPVTHVWTEYADYGTLGSIVDTGTTDAAGIACSDLLTLDASYQLTGTMTGYVTDSGGVEFVARCRDGAAEANLTFYPDEFTFDLCLAPAGSLEWCYGDEVTVVLTDGDDTVVGSGVITYPATCVSMTLPQPWTPPYTLTTTPTASCFKPIVTTPAIVGIRYAGAAPIEGEPFCLSSWSSAQACISLTENDYDYYDELFTNCIRCGPRCGAVPLPATMSFSNGCGSATLNLVYSVGTQATYTGCMTMAGVPMTESNPSSPPPCIATTGSTEVPVTLNLFTETVGPCEHRLRANVSLKFYLGFEPDSFSPTPKTRFWGNDCDTGPIASAVCRWAVPLDLGGTDTQPCDGAIAGLDFSGTMTVPPGFDNPEWDLIRSCLFSDWTATA